MATTQELFAAAASQAAAYIEQFLNQDANVALMVDADNLQLRGLISMDSPGGTWLSYPVTEAALKDSGPEVVAHQFINALESARREDSAGDHSGARPA